MRSCNIGYSDAIEVAIMNALRRHGEVTSVTEDADTTLRLGQWRLITYPHTGHPRWEPVQYLERDYVPLCGQCANCKALTPATIRRTATNMPHLDPESAHILEDQIMRTVLAVVAYGGDQELARAAHEMASQKRTRWYG